MSLPTYEQAISNTAIWPIIASRIPKDLLSSLCLVSKEFNELFAPLLWSDPTRLLFSRPNPYTAFINFYDRAVSAREEVRRQVIVMDFRPLNAAKPYHDIGFRPGDPSYSVLCFMQRLMSVAKIFPSLKFFLVDGLDVISACTYTSPGDRKKGILRNWSVDDTLLSSLQRPEFRYWTRQEEFEPGMSIQAMAQFQPILLSGSRCRYIQQYICVHQYTLNLLYLDVSWPIDDTSYLLSIPSDNLPNLKILKLNGLRLKTTPVSTFLQRMKLRLFSLDLRNNQLTDDIVQTLLSYNIRSNLPTRTDLRPDVGNDTTLPTNSVASNDDSPHQERYMEEPPSYRESTNPLEEQETMTADGRVDMRADDADGVMAHLMGDAHMETIRRNGLPQDTDDMMLKTGITHLYLANNHLTSDGVNQLLQSTNRLQLLDVGSVFQSRHLFAAKNPNLRPICQPDTVKLIKLECCQRLESLRIHHSLVTHTPTLGTIGEYHLSEAKHVHLAETVYAVQEMVVWPEAFLPNINPRLRLLTLTNIPRKSGGLVIERLLNLLHEASIQESLIEDAAPADRRRGARMLSGLRVLRLEFDTLYSRRQQSLAGPSVSEDVDADNFMAESEKDFSFFEDYAQSPISTVKDFSFFEDEGLAPRPRSMSSMSKQSKEKENETPLLRDVEQEIRSYRQKTKAAYEAENERFEAEREQVGGAAVRVPLGAPHYHWTGVVEIVVSGPTP